ncbi:MAG: NEW3 domain-containing protein [Clostridiales bacterium]|nr:NEW3 domain-containing protein [Clostridiales bacterium]
MKCERNVYQIVPTMKKSFRVWSVLLAMGVLVSSMPVLAAEDDEETTTVTTSTVSVSTGIEMNTDYPGMSATAGDTLSYSLDFVSADGAGHDITLTTESLPDGWEGYFKGSSTEISSVHITGNASDDSGLVTYSLSIPDDEEDGEYEVVLLATSDTGDTDTLTLTLNVAAEVRGESSFTSEYPEQQGATGTSFSFDATLVNNRTTDQTYSLSTETPTGWSVSIVPSDDTSTAIASIDVTAESSQGLTITVTPPETVEQGDYTIPVTASSANETLSMELSINITGTYDISLSTSDGLLSFDAYENKASSVTLVITNNGNVDLTDVTLSSSAPTDWEVTFSESTIETLEAGASAEVTAYVTPCEDSITGDYETDITVSTSETSDTAAFRVSVKTSSTWGFVAIGIIVLLVIALGLIFRKFGRR